MSDNSRDNLRFREIHELVSAGLVGNISSDAAARLELLLREDPEARRIYLDYVAETTVLHRWASQELGQLLQFNVDAKVVLQLLEEAEEKERLEAEREAAELAKAEAEAAERRRALREHAKRTPSGQPVILRRVVYFGGVSIAASVLWIALAFFPWGDADLAANDPTLVAPAVPQPSLVATLTESVDAKLITPPTDGVTTEEIDISTQLESRLATGNYLLTRGVVRLEFDSGASVIVEAPASIALKSADRVQLVRGRLVGNVPPAAIGFTVETASATVVDLGTEFGVAALDGQVADISVFDGEVEVVAASNAPLNADDPTTLPSGHVRQRLTANTSVRVDADGAMAIAETQENLFFRELPSSQELAQKIAYERWLEHSQTIAADPDMLAYYTFNDQAPGDKLLLNHAGDGGSMHGDIQNAQWEVGRWPQKQSLRFGTGDADDVPASYVQLDIPGTFDVLTTCTWVNVDVATRGLQSLLLSDGVTPDGRLHWQIRRDGFIQAGFYASTKPPDPNIESNLSLHESGLGLWHHVATVWQAELGQVTYYIDGQRAGVKQGDFHSTIGLGSARIGGWKPGQDYRRDEWRTLRGRMDELAVFKRALSDVEIQAMYAAGSP